MHRADNDTAGNVFRQIYQCYQEAARITPVTDVNYEVAGHPFRLSFAGDSLIPWITPALEHLRTAEPRTPEFQVCLWDTASTGVALPDVGRQVIDLIARRDLSSQAAGRFQIAYNSAEKTLSIYDLETNVAVHSVYDVAQATAHYAGSPLLDPLHWWLGKNQLQLIHAGAIGLPDGGVLLIGEGGAGKSTTALASLRSNLYYAADDYCLVGYDAAPCAYSIYNSGKVNADNLFRFPHLVSAVSNGDRLGAGKALIFLQSVYPNKLIARLPLRAIFLPTVTGLKETRITPMPRLEAMRPLLGSTMRQLTGANEQDFKAIAACIRKLPCFRLEVGTDLDGVTDAIEAFLQAA